MAVGKIGYRISCAHTTACVLTTTTVLELIIPFHLCFNPELIFKHFQIWSWTCIFFSWKMYFPISLAE
uniref:Uncharacterized protein n=1 Tax=Sus scrofa TaxID=9823 RepID=A0A8W4FLR9_PIG